MLVNDPAKLRRQTIMLAVILAVLQLSVVPNIGIGAGRANLCLVFVGCMCLGGSSQSAPIYGFCAGLFYDLTSSGPIGLMALLLTVTAWILSLASQTRVADDLLPSITLFAPVAGIVNLIYAIVLVVCGMGDGFVATIIFRALPAAILDIACFALVGFIMSRTGGSNTGLGGTRGRSGYSMKRGL